MITILCSGSRGDYQPYIALAQELIALGKEVRITAGKNFEPFLQNYGIEIYPVENDFTTLDIDPALLEAAASSDNPLKMLLTFNKMRAYGKHLAGDFYEACKGSELVVYHPGCTMGWFAAQELGIPCVLASPFPLHRTKTALSVVLYGRAPSNPLTRSLSYALLQGMLWMASKDSVHSYWKEEKGRRPASFRPPYESHCNRRHPAVVSCSDAIFPRPADWNPHIHQHGYWFVREPEDAAPDPRLLEFLAQGEKPVYVGFGSMASLTRHPGLGGLVVDAVQKTGRRAILCGLDVPGDLPARILAIKDAPHTWLFPQVSAVCHHAGAGTAAAAFRAGVPSIPVPFSNDQFAWAHRAWALGVAPRPLPAKRLTAEALAVAIQAAHEGDLPQKAKALAEAVASENGARDCARVILDCLNG